MPTPTTSRTPGQKKAEAAENLRWFFGMIFVGLVYVALVYGGWILFLNKVTPPVLDQVFGIETPSDLILKISNGAFELLALIILAVGTIAGLNHLADDDIPALGWFGFVLGFVLTAIVAIAIF